MTGGVLNTRTLCRKLGRSPAWLYRNRKRLEAQGFPAPLPGFGWHCYSEAAVDAWLNPPARVEGDPVTVELNLADNLQDLIGGGRR